MAVGYSITRGEEGLDDSSDRPLAERWNGSVWKPEPVRVGKGWSGVYLSGVSCSSVNACTAVGNYYDAAGDNPPLAERWDGSAWSIQTWGGGYGEAGGATVNGVSCGSRGNARR